MKKLRSLSFDYQLLVPFDLEGYICEGENSVASHNSERKTFGAIQTYPVQLPTQSRQKYSSWNGMQPRALVSGGGSSSGRAEDCDVQIQSFVHTWLNKSVAWPGTDEALSRFKTSSLETFTPKKSSI